MEIEEEELNCNVVGFDEILRCFLGRGRATAAFLVHWFVLQLACGLQLLRSG
jgi:hypothetical protein